MAIRRMFIRFLTGYVLLLLVPLSMGTVITRNFVSEYGEKVVESRIGQLEQARDIITRYVNELEWRVYRIAGNTALNRYLASQGNGGPDEPLLLKQIVTDLNEVLLYDSSLVSVFYVHVLRSEKVLTPNSVYDASDFTDGKTYFRMDGVPTREWIDEVFGRYHHGSFYPAVPVTFEDFKNKPMVPYVRSLPLTYGGGREDVTAAIVYFIGEEEFTGLIRHITLPPGGYAYIADGDNRILSSRSTESDVVPVELPEQSGSGSLQLETAGSGKSLITYVVSQETGWRFVSVLPVPWVFRSVRFMQMLSYGVLLLALLLSAGISAVISWRRSENLRTLFGLIGSDGESDRRGSDYRDLNAGVSRLVRINDEMKREIQVQKQFVFRNFLNRLLNGYYRDEDSLSQFRDYLGLPGGDGRYTAVALLLSGRGRDDSVFLIRELEALKSLIRGELQSLFAGDLWIYESDENLVACVFSSPPDRAAGHEDAVMTALGTWIADHPQTASFFIHLGVGDTVMSLLRIHSSWVHAREAGEYAVRLGGTLARFIDIERELDSYYYPIELESRLFNAVRAGDAETLEEVFRVLRTENLENRNLPEERAEWLLSEIRSSLRKLENRYGRISSDEESIPQRLPDGLEAYRKKLTLMCEEVSNKKRSHNSTLVRRIEEHIQTRYTDHNLSLSSVAAEFSITESYLSYFFKEQTGENFSARVEGIRIARAEQLLTETGLSIAEIAVQVGYNSDKTFRRVFRRLKGTSPNEYRQDMRLRRIV